MYDKRAGPTRARFELRRNRHSLGDGGKDRPYVGPPEDGPYDPIALLDVAGWRTTEHRLVGVERVPDLAVEIEIVLGRLRRRRRPMGDTISYGPKRVRRQRHAQTDSNNLLLQRGLSVE